MSRILKYIRKELFAIIISLVFAGFSVAASLYIIITFGDIINLIAGKDDVLFLEVNKLLLRVIIATSIVGVTQLLQSITNNAITYKITKRLRNDAFCHLQTLPVNFFDNHSNGDIISRVINDVDQFADGLLLGFTQMFTGIATIVGTLICLFTINYIIALIVVFLTPLSLFVAKFITKKTYHFFKEQSAIKGEQTGYIEEMITNLKMVKAYNQEESCNEKFDVINIKLRECSQRAIFYSALVNPSTRFVNSVVYAAITLVGAFLYFAVDPRIALEVGSISVCLSFANQYTKPFNEISMVISEFQNALACSKRIFELIDEKSEVEDMPNSVNIDASGDVSFENVSFSYDKNKKLLENINLNILPGMKVAIVGPTGCGKTTLINLLMRFYDVDNGIIKIDHIPIKDIKKDSLRKNIGMVLQDTWIKTATVFENLTIGKPDASLEEVITASKRTHAHSFIKRLPNGYDTIISDEGNLSAGEKQLLCITRVMISSPKILILDEATSSIDTITEKRIDRAFERLMTDKTTFIVAHRLSTIENADLILVMNNGNIVETGTNESLLKRKGVYANIYNSQFIK